MAINLTQGLLAAVALRPRNLPKEKLFAAAGLAAAMPGPLGLLLPLLLVKDDKAAVAQIRPVEFVELPNVIDRSEVEAIQELKDLGFVVDPPRAAHVKGAQAGLVVAQEPMGPLRVVKGSHVVLFVQVAEPATCAGSTQAA